MSQTEPVSKDKVTAQLIANHLMQQLHDIDLRHSEYAHTMIDRAFSVLMEMVDQTDPYDIYLSLICFMQELEVGGFKMFEGMGGETPGIATFTMKREFVPITSSACINGLRSRGIHMDVRDIRSVMTDPCLSVRGDPAHPKNLAKSFISGLMGKA